MEAFLAGLLAKVYDDLTDNHMINPLGQEILKGLQWMLLTLLSYNDFESFSKKNAQSKTFQCTLYKSEWQQVGDELHYVVWGNRFLRGMVRALVGTQLRVARGKYSFDEFQSIIESKDCSKADFSVPGFGLYLEQINYPEGLLLSLP